MRDDAPVTHQRSQQQIDAANAKFWSGLCGTLLAQGVGVTDASAARPFAVGVSLNRALFLNNIARLAGLDLYVTATR